MVFSISDSPFQDGRSDEPDAEGPAEGGAERQVRAGGLHPGQAEAHRDTGEGRPAVQGG